MHGIIFSEKTLKRWPCKITPSPASFEVEEAVRYAVCASRQERFEIPGKNRVFQVGPRPIIMGVLNVTPDSFYAGSRAKMGKDAVQRGIDLIERGADWIDVGGESTRPGAAAVSEKEELERVIPLIRGIKEARPDTPISIDTLKAAVAREALDAGAEIVNDVSALSFDPAMAKLVAERGCPVVLNHMRGTPQTMQDAPTYKDCVGEIYQELLERVERGLRAGISANRIIIDPGIGFGKRVQDNLEILRRLSELRSLGMPILVGVSRKNFLGKLLEDRPVDGRLFATAAAVASATLNGAKILRVHDPEEMKDVTRIAWAIAGGE